MRPARPSPTQASVERLLGDGLDRYRYGDYDGAIETWERALALDPDEYRAAAWVEFVRAHHDALLGAEPVAEHLVPFGLAGSEDGADYQIEIE
jgi:tetratricopeptide (TPR) repeat protein